MNADQLFQRIRAKSSFLCVGLDSDINRLPKHLTDKPYPLFEFNKRIVDATEDLVVAYKPNIAFYESLGAAGWMSLEMTVNYIRRNFPDVFLIADAKRGDIGNTSRMYAEAFFNQLGFDAITLSPYMGRDSIGPFLEFSGKWSIILGLTSNEGSADVQGIPLQDGQPLFHHVIRTTMQWGTADNTMYVVGATRADELSGIRALIPDHFLLIPGVGAQGGSLEEVARKGMNDRCGLLVNASRSIIYADITKRFEIAARQKAIEMRDQMHTLLKEKGLV
jgi:orotidine-5'-phosphate decarboxylase